MAQQVTTTQPSQYIQDLLTREGSGLFPQLSKSLDQQYQRYSGPRIAGFSEDQLRGFDLARESVGATQGQEEQAGVLLDEAGNVISSGTDQAQQLLDQSVTTGSDWLTRALQGSQDIAEGSNARFEQAGDLLAQSAEAPTAAGLEQYMNPFQDEVIDSTVSELRRQDAIARQGRNAQAVSSGAFGGSRQAVAEQEAQRNLSDVIGRTVANLEAENYGQAMDTYRGQQQLLGQLGGQTRALGETEVGTQQRALDRLMSGGGALSDVYSGAAGTQAGLTGQEASSLTDLATKELGLGSFIREQDVADVSNLLNIGSQQQQMQQQAMDTAYDEFLREREYEDPRAKVSFMSDIIRGAPSGSQSMSTTYRAPQSPLQTVAGLAPLAMAFI